MKAKGLYISLLTVTIALALAPVTNALTYFNHQLINQRNIKIDLIPRDLFVDDTITNQIPASFKDNNLSLNQLLSFNQSSSKSKKLITEVSNFLRTSQTHTEQIYCSGTKLGKHYDSLSEARVAPFKCRLSKKVSLEIYAQNLVVLPSGRAIPVQNAKNFKSMPRPIYFSYQITSWKFDR